MVKQRHKSNVSRRYHTVHRTPCYLHGTSYSVDPYNISIPMPCLKMHVRAYLIGDTQSTRCSKHGLSYILIKLVRAMLSTLIKLNKTGRARFTSPQGRQPHPSLSPHLRGLLSLLGLLADSNGRQRYSTKFGKTSASYAQHSVYKSHENLIKIWCELDSSTLS